MIRLNLMKDTILLSRSFYPQSLYFYRLRLKLRDYYFLGITLIIPTSE